MPFKSQAQRRKCAEVLVQGKISGKTFEEWNRETGKKKLPEREEEAHPKAPKITMLTGDAWVIVPSMLSPPPCSAWDILSRGRPARVEA